MGKSDAAEVADNIDTAVPAVKSDSTGRLADESGGEDPSADREESPSKSSSARDDDGVDTTTCSTKDDDDEIWYAARDGGFFLEKRRPFFYFNFVCYTVSMGFFCFCVVKIVQDYIDNNANPPTSQQLENQATQRFPGMVICNYDQTAPLEVVGALFYNETNDFGYDISDQVQTLECDRQCIQLDSRLPAFQNEGDSECTGINSIVIGVDVNTASYSANSSLFVGIEGLLHAPGKGREVGEALCDNLFPKCESLAPSFDSCPEDLTELSFSQIRASTNSGTFFGLRRSETEATPKCDKIVLSWNPVATVMSYNLAALSAIFGDAVSSDNLVTLQFQFNTPMVSKVTYNPSSGFSTFGSLSGWYGFLTDGWGIISLLFFLERSYLYIRDRYLY